MKKKNYGSLKAADAARGGASQSRLVNGGSGSRALSADIENRVMAKGSSARRSFVNRYFKLEERGTTVGKEIRAGTATFLTMAYILLVNPEILGRVSRFACVKLSFV